MKRYKTGTKAEVIYLMAYHAIRDQEALIDANTPLFGKPSGEQAKAITDCKALIEDYRRIARLHGSRK